MRNGPGSNSSMRGGHLQGIAWSVALDVEYYTNLTFTTLKYFCIYHKDHSFFSICNRAMSSLALSALFDYLCHGSTTIENILIFSESDVYRRQILTYTDGHIYHTSISAFSSLF